MYVILLSPSGVHVMRVCVLPDPCPHSKGEKGAGRKFMCQTLYQVMNIHLLVSSSHLSEVNTIILDLKMRKLKVQRSWAIFFWNQIDSMWEGPIHTQPVWLFGLRWLYHVTDSQHKHSSPPEHLMIHFFRTGHLLISDWPHLTLFNAMSHVKEAWTECLRTSASAARGSWWTLGRLLGRGGNCRPERKHAPAGTARERAQTPGFYFCLRHEPLY